MTVICLASGAGAGGLAGASQAPSHAQRRLGQSSPWYRSLGGHGLSPHTGPAAGAGPPTHVQSPGPKLRRKNLPSLDAGPRGHLSASLFHTPRASGPLQVPTGRGPPHPGVPLHPLSARTPAAPLGPSSGRRPSRRGPRTRVLKPRTRASSPCLNPPAASAGRWGHIQAPLNGLARPLPSRPPGKAQMGRFRA